MVNVGDDVFVAPLHGQKENIAIITGPVGQTGSTGAGGIVEGDYNTWTWKWSWTPSNGVYSTSYIAFYIDEINDIFYLWWYADSPKKIRFGSYNIADHSPIFESPTDSDYMYEHPRVYGAGDYTFWPGCHSLWSSIMRSHQTYILLDRADLNTIEVWKAGNLLWSHNLDDEGGGSYAEPCATEISLTGKYILIYECSDLHKLILYEGFDSGTSTTVTETVITDTAKAWAVDNLIGHIVYIISGGADGQSATITSNTATAITCSAVTFVTWGMSVGDTYKIS